MPFTCKNTSSFFQTSSLVVKVTVSYKRDLLYKNNPNRCCLILQWSEFWSEKNQKEKYWLCRFPNSLFCKPLALDATSSSSCSKNCSAKFKNFGEKLAVIACTNAIKVFNFRKYKTSSTTFYSNSMETEADPNKKFSFWNNLTISNGPQKNY